MSSTVHDVAAAVLARVGPTEAMKLQKLVYYSQAWHLALTDSPLFPDTIQAWKDGPVVQALWQGHRGRRSVGRWEPGNGAALAPRSAAVVDLVCQVYGGLSGDELSELTHQELPWRQARGNTPEGQASQAAISTETMTSYYRGRELAGRSVADLVSGGLAGLQNPQITAAERRRLLADIRAEYAGSPRHEPGPPPAVGTAQHGECALTSNTQVRVDRTRPTRERAR